MEKQNRARPRRSSGLREAPKLFVNMPEDIKSALDKRADELGLSTSTLVRILIRDYLKNPRDLTIDA